MNLALVGEAPVASHCKKDFTETCYKMDEFEEPSNSNGLKNMWYL